MSTGAPPAPAARVERFLGRYGGGQPGPTLIATGGMHGNEPAGVDALRRVLGRLETQRLPLRGELIALAGNTRALARRRRYLNRDLNRHWTGGDVAAALARAREMGDEEDRERLELMTAMAPTLAATRRQVVFVDLHSTSGSTVPFAAVSDVLRSRLLAGAAGLPVVMGLEEALEGSLLGYLTDLGHVGIAIEGGQHEDPETVAHHEAALWAILVATGALAAADVPDLAGHRARLALATRGRPPVIEIRHRHAIAPRDHFVMEPGFHNFDRVARGTLLARDRHGPIRAVDDAVMMLPLYQAVGEEGFFLAHEISPRWLRVGAALRRLGLPGRLAWLPGVRRDPEHPDAYLVSPRAAGPLRRGVLHTLGFRLERQVPGGVRFARRRPDAFGVAGLPPELRGLVPSDGAATEGAG